MKKIPVAILLVLIAAATVILLYRNSHQGMEGQADLEYISVAFGHPLTQQIATYALGDYAKPSAWKLPETLREGEVLFFEAELAGQTIMMVGQPGNPPNLYVDTDGDNDLTDEKPFAGRTSEHIKFMRGPKYSFGPVSATLPGTEPRREIHFFVASYGNNFITMHRAGYQHGKIRLGKHHYRIAVLDANHDGFYKTSPGPFQTGECDILAVDVNLNKEFDWQNEHRQDMERRPLGEYFNLDDSYYAVTLPDNGAAITLKRIDLPMGVLAVPNADMTFRAMADNGLIHYCQSKTQYTIAAGTYRLMDICLNRQDAQGNSYTVNQDYDNLEIALEPHETKMCDIGPPFTWKISVNQYHKSGWFSKGKRVSISPVLAGQGGETYSTVIEKNGQPAPPPKFKIVDEKENILASGQFEYG